MNEYTETLVKINKMQNLYSVMSDNQKKALSEIDFWSDSPIHFNEMIEWMLEQIKDIIRRIKYV